MVRKDDQGRRLCTATTRQGNPCRSPARTGATVCRMHGGSAPQTEAKAARVRLEELVDPVMVEWRELLKSSKTPPAVKVMLGKHILDYAGYKPILEVRGMPTVAQFDEWIEELEAEQA